MQHGSTQGTPQVTESQAPTLPTEIKQHFHRQMSAAAALLTGIGSTARLAIDDGYASMETLEDIHLLVAETRAKILQLHQQLMND